MTHPRFPLAEDHTYTWGVKPTSHDGSFGFEGLRLADIQRVLRTRWGFRDVTPSGHLDLATQAAVTNVQIRLGYTPNGELGKETWDAIFTHPLN